MKNILFVTLILFAANTFGQAPTGEVAGVKAPLKRILVYPEKGYESDTTIRIIYADKKGGDKEPAYFLDGEFVSQSLMQTLLPAAIERIYVVKKDTLIGEKMYYGQIRMTTKSDYKPKTVSISFIKENLLNLKGQPAIFMIDGHLVREDYDKSLLDRNYILSITVRKVENTKEKVDVNVVKILTKSKQNIEKANEIRIKGANDLVME